MVTFLGFYSSSGPFSEAEAHEMISFPFFYNCPAFFESVYIRRNYHPVIELIFIYFSLIYIQLILLLVMSLLGSSKFSVSLLGYWSATDQECT